MENEIYLRRKNKIILDEMPLESTPSVSYIATIIKNIESLGYTFSENVIKVLKTYSVTQLEEFYLSIINDLKQLIGANKIYSPMYPNFPKQVMAASDSELYINAIIHYWSNGNMPPDYTKEERLPLFEDTKLKVIELGTREDFNNIFKNLLVSKTSVSDTDKKDIEWFFKNKKDDDHGILPEVIPLKENVALVSKLIIDTEIDNKILFKYFKTATDVLRLATALSEGDISLATNTKYKSFKRKERRLILSLLENCDDIEEDMKRYKNRWIRLGERLHPSEYKDRYKKSQAAFSKLRNNEKIITFNGKLDATIKNLDFDAALELLKQRPGEFARKLDHLLRIHPNSNVVVNEFKQVASAVSTPVLLQVLEHFKHRNDEKEIRAFFPKGNVAKVFAVDNKLPKIDDNICKNIVRICESVLIQQYKQKEYLGKVYIDEALKDYLVPFSQRSASKSLKSIVRGSKVDFPTEVNTLRAFIYWKDSIQERVDVDLSAVMYDEEWNYLEHISYTNLKSSTYKAYHSGDITSAPNGASEFIDLDIQSIKKYGGRYVVLSINNFTEQPFVEIPECFMGVMNREKPNSGEIYEPKTIDEKIDVTASTSICIPMILDLHENKSLWTDIALKSDPRYYNNIEGNKIGMVLMGKALTTINKTNMYDLLDLHVKARGERCYNKDESDIIFSVNEGITPFDQDIIVSQYL